MKILIVNTYHFLGGGDSTYAFNLAELLRKNGHKVAFFAMNDPRNLPNSDGDLFVSNIDYRKLNQNKDIIGGFKVVTHSIYSLEARKKFNKLLGRFKPDIIHLQNIHHHITTSIIFEAKRHNLPVVWTLHDYKLMCPNTHFLIDNDLKICELCKKNRYYFAALKRCKKNSILASCLVAFESYFNRLSRVYDKVDFFLSPSFFLKKKLIEHGFPVHKIIHLPFFLPDKIFNPSKKSGDYFLFLGKIEPLKGIEILIDACRINSRLKLKIAGRIDETLKEKFLSNLPPNVEYLGMKQGNELYELIDNSIALVLPSICYENQPFSILESFARAKPVIVSNLGGMAELVKHKERGLSFSPNDARALANAMEWLLSHPDEADQMGRNAYGYIQQEHSAEKHYYRLMKIYSKVVA